MSAGITGGFNCPFCGQHYGLTPQQVPQYAGQTIECTVCKRQFTVPAQLTASGQAPQPAGIPYAQQYAPHPPQARAWSPHEYAGPLVSPPSSGLAIASLICGLLFFIPFIAGILGVVFGIIAITQTRGGRAGGRGLAVAGLVCGALSVMFWGSCFLAPLGGFNRAMRQAKQSAKQVQCSANLQQIGAGLGMYAANNNGKYPPKLGKLLEGGLVTPNVFVCPQTTDTPARGPDAKTQALDLDQGGHLSYIYIGQNLDQNSPDDAVLVYEKLGNHGNQGTNVLFKDGHVEWYDAAQTATLMAELNAGHNPPQQK